MADGTAFDLVVNAASSQKGPNGDNNVYVYADLQFTDPIVDTLKSLDSGVYTAGFPRLDYWQDRSLLDLRRMRGVPYAAADGTTRLDVNDLINGMLTIDASGRSETLPFFNGHTSQGRDFWRPTAADVIVYGFGFKFPDPQVGLHETHMNQGNPAGGGHENENGAFQDGGLIVQRGDSFAAFFTAFQTQYLPTDARGRPVTNARALPDYVLNG